MAASSNSSANFFGTNMIILAQATMDVPWNSFTHWLEGLVGFLSVMLLVILVIYYGRKTFGRRPPIDDDLKKLRSEIYHAKNSVRKEVVALIATESKRIAKLEERYEEMQVDRARKWEELKGQVHDMETTLAFIRGKLEQEDKLP
jgi:hypothetical protein